MEELPKKEGLGGSSEFPEDERRKKAIRTMRKDMEMLLAQKYGSEAPPMTSIPKKPLPEEPPPEKKFLPEEEKIQKKIIPLPPSASEKKSKLPRPTLPSTPKIPLNLVLVLIIIVLILGAAVFGYYKFFVQPPPSPSDGSRQPQLPSTPSILVPESLIPVKETVKISLEQKQDLSNVIQKRLEAEYEPSTFTRILTREKEKDAFLTLPEFLDALKITLPTRIFKALEDNFTFFVYDQEQKIGIGFVAKFNPGDDYPMLEHRVRYWEMRNWEKSMGNDLNTMFFLLGKERGAAAPQFADAARKGIDIRYLTFGGSDVTLQYALLPKKDFLIITTSGESMNAIIDLLIPEEPIDETANWMIYRNEGFGYEIKYPNTWFLYDKGLYAGGDPTKCLGGQFEAPKKEVFFASHEYINCIPLGIEIPYEFKILARDPKPITCESNELYSASYMILKGDIEACRRITIKQRWAYKEEITDWGYATYIEFNHGNRGYFIEYINQDKRGVHNPLYDQILSTFKLIGQ